MSIHFANPDTVAQTGLLEQDLLLLSPATGTGRRSLLDAAGEPVGFAVPQQHTWHPTWWPMSLSVHEAFEEPVVFHIQRQWTIWPRWLVRDADNEVIGTVGGAYLWNRWERVLFRRVGRRAFVTAEGTPAAEWTHEVEHIRLLWHPAVQVDPFAKMLLLAAVLVSG